MEQSSIESRLNILETKLSVLEQTIDEIHSSWIERTQRIHRRTTFVIKSLFKVAFLVLLCYNLAYAFVLSRTEFPAPSGDLRSQALSDTRPRIYIFSEPFIGYFFLRLIPALGGFFGFLISQVLILRSGSKDPLIKESESFKIFKKFSKWIWIGLILMWLLTLVRTLTVDPVADWIWTHYTLLIDAIFPPTGYNLHPKSRYLRSYALR